MTANKDKKKTQNTPVKQPGNKKNTKAKGVVEETQVRSKGTNIFLWVIAIIFVLAAALIANASLMNRFFDMQLPFVAKVLGATGLVVVGLILAALTNQGIQARSFFKESRIELRKIVWPTRQEATQTTLIVMGVTVVVSLILWGFDSIIVAVLTFLTDLRF